MLFIKQIEEQREFILDHLYPLDELNDTSAHYQKMETGRRILEQLLETYESIVRQAAAVPKLVSFKRQCETVASLSNSVQSLQAEKDRLKEEGVEVIDLYDADDKDILKLVERRFGHGAAQICRERGRQVSEEGYDKTHDDQHVDEQIAIAAALYAMPAEKRPPANHRNNPPHKWPWNEVHWKPTPDNRERELEKAGALVAAEIDRLDRLKETICEMEENAGFDRK